MPGPRRKAGASFRTSVEHRLQIEGRAADNLEHVGGGGLLLERLARSRALAQFVEQPRVLDGDDGLSGEVRHQLDLLVGERPYLLAIDDDGPEHLAFFQHRNRDHRADAGDIDCGYRQGIAVEIGPGRTQVGNLDRLPGLRSTDEADLRIGMIHSPGS